MNTAVTKPAASGLAALASLRSGLAQVRTQIPASVGGQPLLRLLKDGQWVMGQEDSAITNGTEVIVNPMSFQSGYSCWTNRAAGQGKNELLGEEMWGIGVLKPMAHDMPVHHDPRTQERCVWKDCLSVDMKLLNGPFDGQQTLYKVTSVGGVRGMTALLDAIMAKLDTGSEYICPILQLSSDNYQHKSYGRTYVPVLEIVGWANMEGNEEGDDGAPTPVDEVIEKAAPPVTRQRTPEPEPVKEPEAAAAPAGRRRRV